MQTTALPYVIGIDIGTGSTKAVAINSKGDVLATAQEHYPTLQPQLNLSEQEPEAIWQGFVKAINTIQAKLKGVPSCICLSSCMHSLLLLDEAANPLTKLITWADNRSAAIAERLRNTKEAETIYNITGTPIHSMSPLCKLIWFREKDAEIFRSISKAISIKEYIWFRLFGVFEVDYSIASATGLFSNKSFSWSKEALALAGITGQQLSKIVSTHHTRDILERPTAKLLHLPPTTLFCIGASDGCFANVGSAALTEGTAAVTIGTSAAVRIAGKKPLLHFASMLFSYVLDEETFICGAPTNNGGNVVQWLQHNFMEDGQADYLSLFQKIEVVRPGCDGLICLPYLHGERSPVWDEKAAGAFIGVRSVHTQAHFLRAALEGVCFSLKTILEIIEAQSFPIKILHAGGGFIQSDVWVQLLADVTGKQVYVVQTEDASATGAAIWALEPEGLLSDLSTVNHPPGKIVNPDPSNRELYNRHYKIYKDLYPVLRESMHQLSQVNV